MAQSDARRLADLEEIAVRARLYLDTFNLGEQLTRRTRDADLQELERAVDRVLTPPVASDCRRPVTWRSPANGG